MSVEADPPPADAVADAVADIAADPDLVPAQADAEALAEVYRQGVDSASASPGFSEYLTDTLIYSIFRFLEWLEEKSAWFSWLDSELVADLLMALAVLLTGVLIWRLVRKLMRRTGPTATDGAVTVAASAQAPEDLSRDWAEELHRRLSSGDVPAALEALWWWLASALGLRDADPSWTSRELLLHAGRSDLRRPVRRLDHYLYGPQAPGIEQVGALWRSLRPLVRGADDGGDAP